MLEDRTPPRRNCMGGAKGQIEEIYRPCGNLHVSRHRAQTGAVSEYNAQITDRCICDVPSNVAPLSEKRLRMIDEANDMDSG